MTTRHLLAAAALAAILTLPAVTQAQTSAAKSLSSVAPPSPPSPTPEQKADFRRGIEILRSFGVAIGAKNVKVAVKNRLVACLYANKLGDISRATGKVIKSHPELSDDKPADVWRAAAGVCGITFNKPPSAAAAPALSGKSSR